MTKREIDVQRLEHLEEIRHREHAATMRLFETYRERLDELRDARAAVNDIERLLEQHPSRQRDAEWQDRLRAAQSKLAEAERRLAEADRARNEASDRFQTAGSLHDRCLEWAQGKPDLGASMNALSITGTLAKLLSTTSKAAGELSGGLDQLRTRIAELQGQIADVERQAVTKAEALKRIDHWARRARGTGVSETPISSFTNPSGDGRLPITAMSPAPYLHDFWISLLADDIKARLAERIERHYSDHQGIDDAERDRRLEKLEGELADLEVAEEKLIRTAEAAGLPVLRRRDAPPLIVLAPDAALEA